MTPKTKTQSSDNRAVQFLERKGVIRLFGLALLLAPFVNAALVIWMKKIELHRPLNLKVLWSLFQTGTLTQQALTLSSLGIGLVMLYGSKKAWHFVLALLGCHLFIQVLNIGRDIRENWLFGPFFLVNASIFYFIADQLVFKLKTTPAKTPIAEPKAELKPYPSPAVHVAESPADQSYIPRSLPSKPVVQTNKKIFIHFDGVGPWAQLVGITNHGLQVRGLSPIPFNLESRELEVGFKNGLRLKTKFQRQHKDDFFFEFQSLDDQNKKKLNEWIKGLAA